MRFGSAKLAPLALSALLLVGSELASTGAQEPISPSRVLYNLLATEPFEESELPRGFAQPIVTSTAADDFGDGAIGGVEVAIAIPDFAHVAIASHRISYRVYASPAGAEMAFHLAQARTERQGGQVATLAGFDYPAILLKTAGSATGRPVVGSVALLHVGAVLVAGVSVLEQHAENQADLNASDLAQAGVSHLDRLVFESASATPAA